MAVFIISGFLFLRHLENTKKQRKLSTFEFTIYIIIEIACILFAASLLIFMFAK